VNDLRGKKRGKDIRDYAFQSYFYIQNLASSTNSSEDLLVKRALLMIKRFPNNKAIIDKYVNYVEKHLEPKLKVAKLFPNPFEPNPTNDAVDGKLKLGIVRHSGASFGLNLDEIGEHTLITGRAGAGKTTLIYIILTQLLQYGVPFWAFDFKQDYRHLAKTGQVLVFDWETFCFNPLRPPLGVNPQVWMQAFTNVFCQVYWLLSGTEGVILEQVNKLYTDYGVFSGKDVYPTMFDLYESLKGYHLDRQYGRTAGFLESAMNRVNKCLISIANVFNYDKGFSIEEFLTKNVVFEMEGFLIENQAFLLNIILRYVFQYRISNNQRSGLKHVFLFDEAKSVYSKEREFTKELGVSEIAQFTSKIREFGEGLIVADQMPTKLADSIKANVYTVICMSQSGGPNLAEMSRALGLNPQQEDACSILKSNKSTQEFEAVVKLERNTSSSKMPNRKKSKKKKQRKGSKNRKRLSRKKRWKGTFLSKSLPTSETILLLTRRQGYKCLLFRAAVVRLTSISKSSWREVSLPSTTSALARGKAPKSYTKSLNKAKSLLRWTSLESQVKETSNISIGSTLSKTFLKS
jgi:hypothetical protein